MDFSIILILPFSALIAFATLIGAKVVKRPAPRLIWPFVVSTLATAMVFLSSPEVAGIGLWAFALFGLAFSAAVGTVIGGSAARMVIAAIRAKAKRGNFKLTHYQTQPVLAGSRFDC